MPERKIPIGEKMAIAKYAAYTNDKLIQQINYSIMPNGHDDIFSDLFNGYWFLFSDIEMFFRPTRISPRMRLFLEDISEKLCSNPNFLRLKEEANTSTLSEEQMIAVINDCVWAASKRVNPLLLATFIGRIGFKAFCQREYSFFVQEQKTNSSSS